MTVITGEKLHVYETVELWIFRINKYSLNIPTVKYRRLILLGYVTAGKTLLGKWPLERPIKKWDNNGNVYILENDVSSGEMKNV